MDILAKTVYYSGIYGKQIGKVKEGIAVFQKINELGDKIITGVDVATGNMRSRIIKSKIASGYITKRVLYNSNIMPREYSCTYSSEDSKYIRRTTHDLLANRMEQQTWRNKGSYWTKDIITNSVGCTIEAIKSGFFKK